MTQIVSRSILDTTPDDTINYRNLFRMNESYVQKFRSFKVALSSEHRPRSEKNEKFLIFWTFERLRRIQVCSGGSCHNHDKLLRKPAAIMRLMSFSFHLGNASDLNLSYLAYRALFILRNNNWPTNF